VKISSALIQTHDPWVRKRVYYPLHHASPHKKRSDHQVASAELIVVRRLSQFRTAYLVCSLDRRCGVKIIMRFKKLNDDSQTAVDTAIVLLDG